MHVLLEGVIPLTLEALMKHFIRAKQTTLEEINNGIKNFVMAIWRRKTNLTLYGNKIYKVL